MRKLLVLIALLSGMYTAFAADELISLLPDTLNFPMVTTAQKPAVYEGFDLFTMIDGGAEIYFEYGFEKALSAAYRVDDKERIEIQIYEMSDVPAAYGILSHTRIKSDSILIRNAQLRINNEYYQMCQCDKYFIVLSWSAPSMTLSDMGSRMLSEITGNITNPGPLPEIIVRYLEEGYSHEQLKYIRGPIALATVYFFSHKNVFEIEEAVCSEREGTRQIVFNYAEPVKVEEVFPLLKNEFSASQRFTGYTDDEDTLQFQDKRGRLVKIGYTKRSIIVILSAENASGEIPAPESF